MQRQFRMNGLGRAGMLSLLLLTGGNAMSTEQPDYSVVYKDGKVEYRQYEPYLVAETTIERVGDYKAAGNEGFRRLFRYITGNNQSQTKVAMTVPVAQDVAGESIAMTKPVQSDAAGDGWRVAFMLPSKYTLETAPVPADPRVAIREVPGRLMAVVTYSGRWTERNFEKRKAQLQTALSDNDTVVVGKMQSALYDPPYMPPFMRRNEVMVEVEGLPAAAGEDRMQRVAAY